MLESTDSAQPQTASASRTTKAASSESASGSRAGLKGRIGVLELVMTVLAFSAPVVVVSGFTPFVISFDGAGAPVAYLIAMVLLVLFAVGYTTMSRYLPNPGAFYAYITAGLGKVVGLGSSFLALFGYLGMAVGTYAFFGTVAKSFVEEVLAGPALSEYVYAFACLAAVSALAYFRIDLSVKVLSIAMAAEILIVLIFNGGVLKDGGPEGRSLTPFMWSTFMQGSVGLAIVFAATCFLGFEATAIFREETKDPRRTIPRATYLAVISIGIFYTISTWALILAYGPRDVQTVAHENYAGMFTEAMERYVGIWAKDIVLLLIMTSAFACLLSVQNILSRYVYSLGTDRVLPAALGKVHPRHGSPYVSSLAVSLVMVAILIGWSFTKFDIALTYSLLAGTGGFAVLVLMFLTGIAVVVFFRRHREDINDASVWHTFVAPVLSVLSLGVVLYLAVTHFTIMTGGSTLVALVFQVALWSVFIVGMVLAAHYRRSRPDVYRKIGRQ